MNTWQWFQISWRGKNVKDHILELHVRALIWWKYVMFNFIYVLMIYSANSENRQCMEQTDLVGIQRCRFKEVLKYGNQTSPARNRF